MQLSARTKTELCPTELRRTILHGESRDSFDSAANEAPWLPPNFTINQDRYPEHVRARTTAPRRNDTRCRREQIDARQSGRSAAAAAQRMQRRWCRRYHLPIATR